VVFADSGPALTDDGEAFADLGGALAGSGEAFTDSGERAACTGGASWDVPVAGTFPNILWRYNPFRHIHLCGAEDITVPTS
jgi:hypothetical protein